MRHFSDLTLRRMSASRQLGPFDKRSFRELGLGIDWSRQYPPCERDQPSRRLGPASRRWPNLAWGYNDLFAPIAPDEPGLRLPIVHKAAHWHSLNRLIAARHAFKMHLSE